MSLTHFFLSGHKYMLLHSAHANREREGMDGADACALMVAYGTSHHALKQRANLQPGESLVVFGASGATGIAAVQIGKIMGAKVIGVVSSG